MIIETGKAKIFVREAGSGDPLVLVHGLGMSSELWFNQIDEFSQHFRTFAVDLRGFGQSSKPREKGAYAIEELASDIASVIEQLEIAPTHFLGTSMGGFVGQSLALSRPELCRSLILCHTSPKMSIPETVLSERVTALKTMSLEEYASIVVGQACSASADSSLRKWLTNMIRKNDKEVYTQVLTEGLRDFDVRRELGKINVPTLVITGQHDQVLPSVGGAEIASLINDVELVEIQGVGHLGYAEKPEEFNRAVLSFLGK